MPVRSLNSSVFKWPNQAQVESALRDWATIAIKEHPEILQLGYFGSYARGDWGVGSDLDLLVVVSQTQTPFEQRSLSWDLSQLPVPAELLIYSQSEWQQMQREQGKFAQTLVQETVWIYPFASSQKPVVSSQT